jgi:CheY-like chemotaxis protein
MIARFAVPFRVLVVDDDPTILRFGLIGKGYTVSTARTGRRALKALHKSVPD